MKVCFVTSSPIPPREGIGHHILSLSRCLRQNGVEVTIVTRGRHLETKTDELEGIAIYRATAPFVPPFHLFLHWQFLRPLLGTLSASVDLFHIHLPLVPALRLAKPMVTTFHSSLIEDIKHYETSDARKRIKEFVTNTYYKSVLQRFLDRSQALTAVSSSVAVEIGRYFNRAGLHIPVIPNGVDTQFFEPTGKENGSRVLFVGRLSERKGIIDFMECAEIVHSYHPEAEFLVAGEGPMREALVQRAAKSSASARIHLLGWCSRVQLRDLYQSCSVFVCPSRYEAGPLTLLEAMSSGTSVVSTSVGEANEAIQDGYNGLLVQPAAPRDLAGAVIRLLDDHELRVTVGHNARETVIKRYTWSAAAALLLQVYAQVLGGVG